MRVTTRLVTLIVTALITCGLLWLWSSEDFKKHRDAERHPGEAPGLPEPSAAGRPFPAGLRSSLRQLETRLEWIIDQEYPTGRINRTPDHLKAFVSELPSKQAALELLRRNDDMLESLFLIQAFFAHSDELQSDAIEKLVVLIIQRDDKSLASLAWWNLLHVARYKAASSLLKSVTDKGILHPQNPLSDFGIGSKLENLPGYSNARIVGCFSGVEAFAKAKIAQSAPLQKEIVGLLRDSSEPEAAKYRFLRSLEPLAYPEITDFLSQTILYQEGTSNYRNYLSRVLLPKLTAGEIGEFLDRYQAVYPDEPKVLRVARNVLSERSQLASQVDLLTTSETTTTDDSGIRSKVYHQWARVQAELGFKADQKPLESFYSSMKPELRSDELVLIYSNYLDSTTP